MKSTKVKAGVYTVKHHGFAFTVRQAERGWSLWNESGTEAMRCPTKGGLLRALVSHDKAGTEAIHEQEFCQR